MQVLHVYSGNLFGGVETLLLTLARERHRCPAMCSAFALCFAGRLSDELRGLGAQVHDLGEVRVRRPLSVLRARRALARLLEAQRFDAVVCHSAWAQALFAPVTAGRCDRQVFFLHDASGGGHWLERWARRHPPDAVVCNSRFTARSVRNLYPYLPSDAVHTVYLPVSSAAPGLAGDGRDESGGTDRRERRARIRAALGVSTDVRVIVQACRMQPWKGQRNLLEALRHLRGRPDWEAWIVGGAQRDEERAYKRELVARASSYGLANRVRFLGQRADVPDLLAAADVYCQPNASPEPFGIAFVEALHAGLPVVTTAMGGALEIVTPEVGSLVPPGDTMALAGTLRSTLDRLNDPDERGRTAHAATARARALCDPETRMRELAGAFGGSAGRSG